MGFCNCFLIVANAYPLAEKSFNKMNFLIDPYMREQMQKIECQTCGWIGTTRDLIAAWSDIEPGCPACSGASFMDVEEEKDEK